MKPRTLIDITGEMSRSQAIANDLRDLAESIDASGIIQTLALEVGARSRHPLTMDIQIDGEWLSGDYIPYSTVTDLVLLGHVIGGARVECYARRSESQVGPYAVTFDTYTKVLDEIETEANWYMERDTHKWYKLQYKQNEPYIFNLTTWLYVEWKGRKPSARIIDEITEMSKNKLIQNFRRHWVISDYDVSNQTYVKGDVWNKKS